jgi:hypothetical protein
MFTVTYVEPTLQQGGKLSDTMKWLEGNKDLPQNKTTVFYDAKAALSEIARDAGPTFLCHMTVRVCN